MKTSKGIIWLTMSFLVLTITACGGGLSGVYKANAPMGMGSVELHFISGKKVQITGNVIGRSSTDEFEYEKDGKQIKIKNGNQVQILTVADDGCLEGMGTKFCK